MKFKWQIGMVFYQVSNQSYLNWSEHFAACVCLLISKILDAISESYDIHTHTQKKQYLDIVSISIISLFPLLGCFNI